MSVDINLLEFNQSFLKKLQSDRNVSVSDIKLKFKGFLKPSTYTRLYRSLDSISNTHPDVKLPYAQRKCMYGDMSQIEEIVITNKNFPFFNEFHIYNITGTIRIVDKVRFNGLNKDFYTEEIQRYKKLLTAIFSKYLGAWTEYKKRMDECYVVACYVDKYYNCPDDIDKDVEQDTFIYKDLFIDAGPNVEIWWPTNIPLNTGPLSSLTPELGPTHQTTEVSRVWSVTIVSGATSIPISVEDPSQLYPSLTRIGISDSSERTSVVLTMKTIWPWMELEDSRKIVINYFTNTNAYTKKLEEECEYLESKLKDYTAECDDLKAQLAKINAAIHNIETTWNACITGPFKS